jgi:hypothetical protein
MSGPLLLFEIGVQMHNVSMLLGRRLPVNIVGDVDGVH